MDKLPSSKRILRLAQLTVTAFIYRETPKGQLALLDAVFELVSIAAEAGWFHPLRELLSKIYEGLHVFLSN